MDRSTRKEIAVLLLYITLVKRKKYHIYPIREFAQATLVILLSPCPVGFFNGQYFNKVYGEGRKLLRRTRCRINQHGNFPLLPTLSKP